MSEELLKALMQLFAIIAKQDNGSGEEERSYVSSFLSFQLNKTKTQEYLALYDNFLKDKDNKDSSEDPSTPKKKRLTSVLESVKTLSICKKINKTLAQKQKVVVLIRLYELLKTNNLFTPQRIQIIKTTAEVFNIPINEQRIVEVFYMQSSIPNDIASEFVVINSRDSISSKANHIRTEGLDGEIVTIRFQSVNLLFTNFSGNSELQINGIPVNRAIVYLLAPGSTIRLPRGTIYYSDIIETFLHHSISEKLSFVVEDLEYKFPGGKTGLKDINFSESHGSLVGIMGASGAGKTTLLNVLSGIEKPDQGTIRINGVKLEDTKGLIGYIAQDDLLIEELTVYQNLYFNAQLCFKNKSAAELAKIVLGTLQSLGLSDSRNIVVGNTLNKKISGGQRKRLNIALELIREPAVLFVDEPTSGLSSRDSENVMDLLKELSQKGKLIFVVIHQPSSDIFKMFDKICVLDVGGYNVFYGNPVETVMYFKKAANHVNCDIGECELCGNVNSELVFNILESQEVDEYGNYTGRRKTSPEEWFVSFRNSVKLSPVNEVFEKINTAFDVPGLSRQFSVFIKRDILSKIGNKQYLLINLFEVPALAFILAFLIKYTNRDNGNVYNSNDNIPAYFFMSVIVALLVGLTVSAEEIYKDLKILKRERFLRLSRLSYLLSKVFILFSLSLFQSYLFCLVGNYVLGVPDRFWFMFLMIFSVFCTANLIGLVLSSSFNSPVTIYVIIPLVIIPQMLLGGAMFRFSKINNMLGSSSHNVPPISNLMVSRWAYEGIMVDMFKNNKYENKLFEYDKLESNLNYKLSYLFPKLEELKAKLKENDTGLSEQHKSFIKRIISNCAKKEFIYAKQEFDFHPEAEITDSIKELGSFYSDKNNILLEIKDSLENDISKRLGDQKNIYTNKYLFDLVTNSYEKDRIIIDSFNYRFIQVLDPIFKNPESGNRLLGLSTHFYAPYKYLGGKLVSTYSFNLIIIWIMNLFIFLVLYLDIVKKILNFRMNK